MLRTHQVPKEITMLKHPDKFLPVTTASGLTAEVSTGWNGDFRVRQGEEIYINPFLKGHTFFRVAVTDPAKLEEVKSQELLKSLRAVKDSYIKVYFE
jgi:hypothetical protein